MFFNFIFVGDFKNKYDGFLYTIILVGLEGYIIIEYGGVSIVRIRGIFLKLKFVLKDVFR